MTTSVIISSILAIITLGLTVGAVITEAKLKGRDPFVYISTIVICAAALVTLIFAACGATCALGFAIASMIISVIIAVFVWIWCAQSETEYPERVISINFLIIGVGFFMMMVN